MGAGRWRAHRRNGTSRHFALQQRSQRPRYDPALCRPSLCGCAKERTTHKRWAKAVRSLAQSAVKHDRADEVADAVAACWGIDDNGDIGTAGEDELRGWTPTDMTHHDDAWHIAGTAVFDEDAHWNGLADDEPGATNDTNKGTHALRTVKFLTTRTGTGWNVQQTRLRPRSGSCSGCALW